MAYRPQLRDLLESGRVPEDHPLQEVDEAHPIARPLEYFLGLDHVRGFSSLLKELITRPKPVPTTNEPLKQWASICAELGATSIVGQALGLQVEEFESISPRAQGKKTCDIRAGGIYFEVKRNQTEDSQELPAALQAAIRGLPIPFPCTPRLVKRDYDCADLDELMDAIVAHVDEFLQWKSRRHLVGVTTPRGYRDHRVEVIFHEPDLVGGGGQYFKPLDVEDLCAHLLESGRIGRGGSPMVPMVEQAMAKGADYLVYRASAWGPLEDVVKRCFEGATRLRPGAWSTPDGRLGSLQGVILFVRYDKFLVVESATGQQRLAALANRVVSQ